MKRKKDHCASTWNFFLFDAKSVALFVRHLIVSYKCKKNPITLFVFTAIPRLYHLPCLSLLCNGLKISNFKTYIKYVNE